MASNRPRAALSRRESSPGRSSRAPELSVIDVLGNQVMRLLNRPLAQRLNLGADRATHFVAVGRNTRLERNSHRLPLQEWRQLRHEVDQRHRLLTMWAESTYSHAVAKAVAVITSLRPEGASLALRAGIHGVGPPPVNSADHRRKRWRRRVRLRPPAESHLATRRRTPQLASSCCEQETAHAA